jgi:hypothetical protein
VKCVSVSLRGDGRQNKGKTPEVTACLQDNAVGQFVLAEERVDHLDDGFVRPMDRRDGDHDHLFAGGAVSRGLSYAGPSMLGPGRDSGSGTRHHMLGADDGLGGCRREGFGHLDKARLSGSGAPRFLSRRGLGKASGSGGYRSEVGAGVGGEWLLPLTDVKRPDVGESTRSAYTCRVGESMGSPRNGSGRSLGVTGSARGRRRTQGGLSA